jgi:transposase
MMLSSAVRAYVCAEPQDMRRSIDGLARLVQPLFNADPFSGSVFVFVGKRRDRVKLLVFDRSGFWLMYKRLEKGVFADPASLAQRGLSFGELTAWLDGIDISAPRRVHGVHATRVA